MVTNLQAKYSQTELLREFDQVIEQIRPVLRRRYGVETEAILQEGRLEFIALIPRLPYIGGRRNLHTWNLVASAWYLAFYKVLNRRGEPLESIARLVLQTFTFWLDKTPRWLLRWAGWWKFTPFAKAQLRRRAKESQQRRYPGDFVFSFVEGDGKRFDWGVNYSECAICKLYRQEGAEAFTPYMCTVDKVMSERMGLGLERSQTLAGGAAYCDFRFKRGRPTRVKMPSRLGMPT